MPKVQGGWRLGEISGVGSRLGVVGKVADEREAALGEALQLDESVLVVEVHTEELGEGASLHADHAGRTRQSTHSRQQRGGREQHGRRTGARRRLEDLPFAITETVT